MKLFDVQTAAGVLEVSEEEIRELLKEGELSARKFHGKWMISERQVREYLDKRDEERFSLHWGY